MGVYVWLWLTDRIDRCALSIRVGYAYSASKGIHGVNNKIAATDTLITDLFQ